MVESYYRVRWGSFEEFQQLFEKNHLPFLQAILQSGEHMPGAVRGDIRTTLA